MKRLSPKAIALLRRVKAHILKEPRRIDMSTWVEYEWYDDENDRSRPWPKCGTVGCIGGWVEVLSDAPTNWHAAKELLKINDEQAGELFYDAALMNAAHKQTPGHAKAVARHIERFIRRHR